MFALVDETLPFASNARRRGSHKNAAMQILRPKPRDFFMLSFNRFTSLFLTPSNDIIARLYASE
jgi:hypothetical protein